MSAGAADPPPPSQDPLPPSQTPLTALSRSGRKNRYSVRPAPRPARSFQILELPAFWILCGLLLLSAWRLVVILQSPLIRYPSATIAAIMLFAIWAVPFWLFISAMDFMEREPPLLLTTAFAWGAVVATTAAIPGNRAVLGLTAKLISPDFAMAWGPAVASPAIEELLKSLGLVMIVLVARKQINSVLDGMIYGALIGLGFQVVENVFYALSAVETANQGDSLTPVVATFFLRGFLAGLWSHTLFSALAGAGIAWFLVRTDQTPLIRSGGLVLGVWMAWATHFIWNSPLLMDGLDPSPRGLLIGLLLKGLPGLLLAMGLLWVARHREADYYVDKLEQLHDPDIATKAELRTLRHGHLRADARRYGRFRAGTAGQKAVKALQMSQAHLAVELSRTPTGLVTGDPVVTHCRDEVLLNRNRLLVLAHPEAIAYPPRPLVPKIVVTGVTLSIILFVLIWYAIGSMHGA